MSGFNAINKIYNYIAPEAPTKPEDEEIILDDTSAETPDVATDDGTVDQPALPPDVDGAETDADVSAEASGEAKVDGEGAAAEGDGEKKLTKEERKAQREAEKLERQTERAEAKAARKQHAIDFKAEAKAAHEAKQPRYNKYQFIPAVGGDIHVGSGGMRDGSLFNSRGGRFGGPTNHQGFNLGARFLTNLNGGNNVQVNVGGVVNYQRWSSNFRLFGTENPGSANERLSSSAHNVLTAGPNVELNFTFWDRVTGPYWRPLSGIGFSAGLGWAFGRGTFNDSIIHKQHALGADAEAYLKVVEVGEKIRLSLDCGLRTTLADGQNDNNNNWPVFGGGCGLEVRKGAAVDAKPAPVAEPIVTEKETCDEYAKSIASMQAEIDGQEAQDATADQEAQEAIAGLLADITYAEGEVATTRNYIENRKPDPLKDPEEIRQILIVQEGNKAVEGKSFASKEEEQKAREEAMEKAGAADGDYPPGYNHWESAPAAAAKANIPAELPLDDCVAMAKLVGDMTQYTDSLKTRLVELERIYKTPFPEPRIEKVIENFQFVAPNINGINFSNDQPNVKAGTLKDLKSAMDAATFGGQVDFSDPAVRTQMKIIFADAASTEEEKEAAVANVLSILDEMALALDNDIIRQMKGMEVQCHTSAAGSSSHNLKLSKERAATVVELLERKGVQKGLLTPHGFGEEKLLDKKDGKYRKGSTEAETAAAKNRRMEFYYDKAQLDALVKAEQEKGSSPKKP